MAFWRCSNRPLPPQHLSQSFQDYTGMQPCHPLAWCRRARTDSPLFSFSILLSSYFYQKASCMLRFGKLGDWFHLSCPSAFWRVCHSAFGDSTTSFVIALSVTTSTWSSRAEIACRISVFLAAVTYAGRSAYFEFAESAAFLDAVTRFVSPAMAVRRHFQALHDRSFRFVSLLPLFCISLDRSSRKLDIHSLAWWICPRCGELRQPVEHSTRRRLFSWCFSHFSEDDAIAAPRQRLGCDACAC